MSLSQSARKCPSFVSPSYAFEGLQSRLVKESVATSWMNQHLWDDLLCSIHFWQRLVASTLVTCADFASPCHKRLHRITSIDHDHVILGVINRMNSYHHHTWSLLAIMDSPPFAVNHHEPNHEASNLQTCPMLNGSGTAKC